MAMFLSCGDICWPACASAPRVGIAGRIDTSEFYQQTIFSASSGEPRVKASQCFTKYRFRNDAAAAADDGVNIVATQVGAGLCEPPRPILDLQNGTTTTSAA